MPRTQRLRDFARQTVTALGEFGVRYVTPLRAFLQMSDEPESTREVLGRGLTQESLKQQLDDLLTNDEMLAKCCGDSDTLAFALDVLFFGPIPDALYHGATTVFGFGLGTNALDEELDELEKKIYEQGEFSKTAYFHTYNLHVAGTVAHPYPGWRIEEVSYERIQEILQPASYTEFLKSHSFRGFTVIEDSSGFNIESLSDWLTRRWWEAASFRRVLQLAHDGTVDIDYVVAHFNPPWVNRIQGGGIFQMGTPRKEAAPSGLYCLLTSSDSEDITVMWSAVKRYSTISHEDNSPLKRAIGIASEFFEESHRKVSRIERFANLMISLEALYTPSGKSELTLRVSQTCALFVAGSTSSDAPQNIYKFLKSMFARRGKLFHGNYDVNSQTPETFINDDELREFYSLVRRSIAAFICLYIRGERQLDDVRQKLETSILDEQQRELLRERAQLEGLPPEGN